MVLAMLGLLLASIAAAPVDVTGKWDGVVSFQREDGTSGQDSVLLVLSQKDNTVTGTIGSSRENDQHAITSGTVEGNKLVILAKGPNDRDFRIELTISDAELKGTVTSGPRKAELTAKRRKE